MLYIFFTLLAVALVALPICYVRLCGAMRVAAIEHPPSLHFFLVFGSTGGLLITFAFAGSPLGALASIIPVVFGPIAILISSIFLYRRHRDSGFHSAAYWSGLGYVTLIVIFVAVGASLSS